jgi:hypothetical protein
MGWAVLGVLHFSVLVPVSLLASKNINYMLSPPNGPLLFFGFLSIPA